MGKGYHFNMPTEGKARKASGIFIRKVRLLHNRNAHLLTITRTGGYRYIASVDVCGSPSEKIDALARDVITAADGEK